MRNTIRCHCGTNHRVYVNVEGYRRLVARAAWAAWRSLPIQTRAWIEIEDMIEDGIHQLYKHSLHHNLHQQDYGLTTKLEHHLHNYFINAYIEKYGADKRGWVFSVDTCKCGHKKTEHAVEKCDKETAGGTVCLHIPNCSCNHYRPNKHAKVSVKMFSIQGMQEKMRESNDGKGATDDIIHQIPGLVVSSDTIFQNAMTECFVVPTLTKIYQASSDNLKEHLVEWLWFTKEKYHKKSDRFQSATKEFRKLSCKEDLHYSDCLHIIRSPECLDSLSRKIFGIPYSEFCHPIVGGESKLEQELRNGLLQ